MSCILDYLLIVLLRTCLLSSLFFVGSVLLAFKKNAFTVITVAFKQAI